MITLYTFGPYFGLPDGSPFVTKAMLLLKLAGLTFREDRGGYGKAPKGKLPFIDDDGVVVADSTFIRLHIERKYGVDFDRGLTPRERGVAWAVEKMCENHLYWALLDARWGIAENYARGPVQFFSGVPAPVRPLIGRMVRGKTTKSVTHGLGRLTRAEIEQLAVRDVRAIADVLGERAYLMGDAPCGADASVFGFVSGVLAPLFETPIRVAAEGMGNLVGYRDRVMGAYFGAGVEG